MGTLITNVKKFSFTYVTLSKGSQYMITGGAEHLSNEALKLQIT